MKVYANSTAVVFLALLVSCGGKPAAAPEMPPPEVLVTTVLKRDVPIFLEEIGQTRGSSEVQIMARVTGFLETQDYLDGTMVKKGQLLYTIDPKPFQAALMQAQGQLAIAQAELGKAQTDVARYKPLAAEDAISREELDNAIAAERAAQASVQAATANVETARINLGYTKVYSPVDGLAAITRVQVGNLVGPGGIGQLTTVSTINPVRARFNVTEKDYLDYHKQRLEDPNSMPRNPKVFMTLADGTVYPNTGRILSQAGTVDANTGTLMLEAEFSNPQNLILPGQYARVRLESKTLEGALLVPVKAVMEVQGTNSVAVVGPENHVEMRVVQLGPIFETFRVVEKGVKEGERVVVEGLQKVRGGIRVSPKAAPAGVGEANKEPMGTPASKR